MKSESPKRRMDRRLARIGRAVLRTLVYCSVGAAITLIVLFVVLLENRPDLDIWHKVRLDEEFRRGSQITGLQQYLALEARLFRQLDEEVYARTGSADDDRVNRYKRGSLSDPERWTPNWNRTFELPADNPRGSVLLLHGLSDSPYSLRHLAASLNQSGLHALALRLPGHGTAPSGLVAATWQDMAAATELAVNHLDAMHPNLPLHIVGYSNGAALAVEYALRAIDQPQLPRISRMVLISPGIGVTATAGLAAWQARLGWALGLEKLAWNSILPEYDPFKYGSFAINAGDLSHRITRAIQKRVKALGQDGRLDAMPPILAFSSAVDATVLAPALVDRLFNQLPPGGHELVLFDINNISGLEPLLRWDPDEMVDVLRLSGHPGYSLTLLTNAGTRSAQVMERHWRPSESEFTEHETGMEWPQDVFSLSHIALPFPVHDPLYGAQPSEPSPGVHLGDIAMRGERGVLYVSSDAMLRLRWNPFYPYLEQRTLGFLGLEPAKAD